MQAYAIISGPHIAARSKSKNRDESNLLLRVSYIKHEFKLFYTCIMWTSFLRSTNLQSSFCHIGIQASDVCLLCTDQLVLANKALLHAKHKECLKKCPFFSLKIAEFNNPSCRIWNLPQQWTTVLNWWLNWQHWTLASLCQNRIYHAHVWNMSPHAYPRA